MEKTDEILARLDAIDARLSEQTSKPLTLEEAAAYIDMSRSHLYKLTSSGEIPHYKPQGKRCYFAKPELDKWLLRNPIKTNAQIDQEATDFVTIGRRK